MHYELCRTTLGLSYAQALCWSLGVLLCSGVSLWAAIGVTPGARRLMAAAPVIALNFLLPKLFCRWEDSTTIVLTSFNIMWLATMKAVSWAFCRGSLCMQPLSPSQFVAAYIFPITPLSTTATASAPPPAHPAATQPSRTAGDGGSSAEGVQAATGKPVGGRHGRLADDAGGIARMVASFLTKHLVMLICIYLLQTDLPGLVESFVFGLALYALLSLIMDGPAALAIGSTGLRVSPHFDRPWRSTSVASFWSKRWDLAAGNTLRQLVYDSVVEGSLMVLPPGAQPPRPSTARQALGSLASFAVSGLFHEMIFWYLTGHTTRLVWLSFFLVQAPIIVVERLALAALKRRGILLPAWLRACVSMLLVVATAQYLFWAPPKQYGVTDSVVKNVYGTIQLALKSTGLVVST